MNNQSCYDLLGLHEGASIHEIKTAYRRLALRYHPDKTISKHDDEKFKLITEAYRTLRSNSVLSTPLSKINNHSHHQDNLGSKAQYCNEPKPEKLSREWFYHSKYVEKAYRDFRKCGYESWKYFEKMKRIATIVVLSSVAAGRNVRTFHVLYGYNMACKKVLKIVKSNLNLWNF